SQSGEGYKALKIDRPVEKKIRSTNGVIQDSLFAAGHDAGLSDRLTMQLADIFGWDIDFALEIRTGDRFSLIYEEQFVDGKKLRSGPILAAEFINQGHVYKAIRYTDKEGRTAYFSPDGKRMQKAFLRTPVKYARISSRFTRKRWHPVLKKWRSHKGVDYAAARGTPIRATGDGKVIVRGKKGGYGNAIYIQHGRKYTTVYGHLSRFAKRVKKGSKVHQGQIIGYVGSTGLATGPHLHYEFRVNGIHRNPLTVKLPASLPLEKSQMADFHKTTSAWLAQLDTLHLVDVASSSH
ncbi:MAG: peptidoglycan DD-metalloendopeptidase family protein, partial [gamma proteobacterium symbiont of Bathyaustriella thionipta]|nr:peptidoglycan DD-metalloendopeptidase family protein [gamma proteobacterium symbiont of Bathyaustriella thionipta]